MAAVDIHTGIEKLRELSREGDPHVIYLIGKKHETGQGVMKDESAAAHYYYRVASKGYAPAQNALAIMWATGKGVVQSYEDAYFWFKAAAAQGHAAAECSVGFLYAYGYGTSQDQLLAFKYYTLAADKGNVEAQFNLGVMHMMGQGIAQDDKTASEWFLLSARQGFTLAQVNLGIMFLNGRGVNKDEDIALEWFLRASKKGDQKALGYVSFIQNSKNPTQNPPPIDPNPTSLKASVANLTKETAKKVTFKSEVFAAVNSGAKSGAGSLNTDVFTKTELPPIAEKSTAKPSGLTTAFNNLKISSQSTAFSNYTKSKVTGVQLKVF